MSTSLYDIKIKDALGKPMDLKKFKGKKLLIVNVASECGFTHHYEGLQDLYKSNANLEILGVPCNDFGGQEPGSEEEIVSFCQVNYGVEFPITEKVGILEDKHSLFVWLTEKQFNGTLDSEVVWNFHKFLIDEDGGLVANLPCTTKPTDVEILAWI